MKISRRRLADYVKTLHQKAEEEYKVTMIMASVKLYRNGDPSMAMVRELEERAEKLGHSLLVKETAR